MRSDGIKNTKAERHKQHTDEEGKNRQEKWAMINNMDQKKKKKKPQKYQGVCV